MTKRKVEVSESEFLQFLTNGSVKHAEVERESLRLELTELGSGSIVLSCKHYADFIVCQNTTAAFSLMVSKETQEALRIRYLHPIQ